MKINLPVGLFLLAAASIEAQPLLSTTIIDVTSSAMLSRELLGIRDLYFSPSGHLVVLDLDRVIVFDPDGSELHLWGSTGGGPGELKTPISVAATDDAILVGEGGLVGSYTVDGKYMEAYRLGGPMDFVFDIGFAGDVPVALTMAIMGRSAVRRLTDTVTIMTVDNTVRPGVMFAPIPMMAATTDGLVALTSGADYTITAIDVANGARVDETTRDVEPRSVSTAFQDKLRGYLHNPDSAPEGWSQWVGSSPIPAPMISRMRFSETFPVISRMFTGPGNALWVQRGMGVDDDLAPPIDPPSAPVTLFDLFDLATREYLGVVQLDGDFQPMTGTTTRVAGVVTSGLVPTLRVVEVTF